MNDTRTRARPDAKITKRQTLMPEPTSRSVRFKHWSRDLWHGLRDYFGSLGRRRAEPIDDRASLRRFLETRSNYIAQTSLYGYLRTRAGQIYPQLFEDDTFVQSVNVARWHVWLACLSDLSVYAGGLLAAQSPSRAATVAGLVQEIVAAILDQTGTPVDAGAEFPAHAERVRSRLASCDWARVTDDESPFRESPGALIHWAPIVENLKELDEEIVRNSVRFRWQEIRRDLRRDLDADAVLRAAA
jgi:hypothetical protein